MASQDKPQMRASRWNDDTRVSPCRMSTYIPERTKDGEYQMKVSVHYEKGALNEGNQEARYITCGSAVGDLLNEKGSNFIKEFKPKSKKGVVRSPWVDLKAGDAMYEVEIGLRDSERGHYNLQPCIVDGICLDAGKRIEIIVEFRKRN